MTYTEVSVDELDVLQQLNTATTVRKTYIAAKKEIMIEHIDSDNKVVGTGWVGVHYQSPLYDLTTDTVL